MHIDRWVLKKVVPAPTCLKNILWKVVLQRREDSGPNAATFAYKYASSGRNNGLRWLSSAFPFDSFSLHHHNKKFSSKIEAAACWSAAVLPWPGVKLPRGSWPPMEAQCWAPHWGSLLPAGLLSLEKVWDPLHSLRFWFTVCLLHTRRSSEVSPRTAVEASELVLRNWRNNG